MSAIECRLQLKSTVRSTSRRFVKWRVATERRCYEILRLFLPQLSRRKHRAIPGLQAGAWFPGQYSSECAPRAGSLSDSTADLFAGADHTSSPGRVPGFATAKASAKLQPFALYDLTFALLVSRARSVAAIPTAGSPKTRNRAQKAVHL